MAEPTLKIVPDAAAVSRPRLRARISRRTLRSILLVVVPLAAAAAGFALYLGGGRYITTDNAYVGAQKVLITPDISGKVHRVMVREGQHVKAGDELLDSLRLRELDDVEEMPLRGVLVPIEELPAEAVAAVVRVDALANTPPPAGQNPPASSSGQNQK